MTEHTPDPVGDIARATAAHFTGQFGQSLLADVEAALHTDGTAPKHQYADPIAIGSLIVAIATLKQHPSRPASPTTTRS